MFKKILVYQETFLCKRLSTTDFCILKKSIISHNNKLLQKSLYTQKKKLYSLMRGCSLPTFTANETITNLRQYGLSSEEFDLLEAGLHMPIQPDKLQISEIFTAFENIHRSFINKLKFEEAKSRIKAHFTNTYFCKYKPSPRILRQHRVSQNIRKKKISL